MGELLISQHFSALSPLFIRYASATFPELLTLVQHTKSQHFRFNHLSLYYYKQRKQKNKITLTDLSGSHFVLEL